MNRDAVGYAHVGLVKRTETSKWAEKKVLTLKHSSMSEPFYFANYFLGLRRPVFSEPRTSSW